MTANDTTRSSGKERTDSPTGDLHRRRVLTAIASGSAIALAGCSSDETDYDIGVGTEW